VYTSQLTNQNAANLTHDTQSADGLWHAVIIKLLGATASIAVNGTVQSASFPSLHDPLNLAITSLSLGNGGNVVSVDGQKIQGL